MGGVVSIVGGVSGFGGPELGLLTLIGGMKRLNGILVGSRAMLDDLTRFVSARKIRPVIDQVFYFDDAVAAYRHLESGRHFGKVVVRGVR